MWSLMGILRLEILRDNQKKHSETDLNFFWDLKFYKHLCFFNHCVFLISSIAHQKMLKHMSKNLGVYM